MDMEKHIGSKAVVSVNGNIVSWKCEICGTSGSARLNNWNSPRARTCCGGRFYRNRDRLLIVWTDLRARCLDPKHPAYHRYQMLGSPEWSSYDEFAEWAEANGWKYGLELDRIDNSTGYSKDNCRFVTRAENLRNKRNNRRLTAFGETKIAEDWAKDPRCSVQGQTILARIDRYGWTDIERAISEPAR